MIPITRRELILKELRENELVHIEKLAETIGTSEQTIRRDLMQLEKNGLVERYHGGVAKLVDTSRELSVGQRMQRFSVEKERVGEIAASLINDGDTIFIDGGTTTAAMLNYLTSKKDIIVFTNGIIHIEILEKLPLKVFVIGGELKRSTGCFIGPIALEAIQKCRFDKVFIGANGISFEMGCTNADLNESALKAALVKQGRLAYVLCDKTKFGIESFHKFADLDKVTIITDEMPNEYKQLNYIDCPTSRGE